MSVPGSNLLAEALSLIGSQPVAYFAALPRTTDGPYYEGQFAEPLPVFECSVQPVPRNRYEVLGLQLAKKYVTWFVPQNVIALQRDTTGDQIEWNGDRYQLQDKTDWHGQDGWCEVLCVKVGPADA